jgi:hypothetical protein
MNQLDQIFTDIARNHLSIETLQTRRSDSLDFHNVAVWAVRNALAAAYQAGHEQAIRDLARLRDAAPQLRDTLLYVAQELAGFKPDCLRQLGLSVLLEQVEKALAIADNTAAEASAPAAEDDHQ